ncbi:hypothetical protein H0H10_33225 [Streptomyces sp. TRM S81-3]|uniref:Secreted protein n=1 Tax=Streptomyces griseicoloratus TaxID=2752516 RepID=A0A926QTD3_9ACTN|nr:hypothetical protein [Streptomyces griseicoloratus]MBD0423969.1 hypothetical protein [Streptomyces griseicoloratus]
MLKHTLRAAAVLALVAAVAVPAAASTPVPPETTAPPRSAAASLQGTARLGYPVAEEEVRVSVDAHAAYGPGSFPVRSWGTFRISHVVGGRDHWGDFEVDCLTTGGPTATVTGRLVRTSPGHVWRTELEPHTRMGVSFHVPPGGTARVGLSGATAKGEPLLTRCMAPAADMEVVDGRYSLRAAR